MTDVVPAGAPRRSVRDVATEVVAERLCVELLTARETALEGELRSTTLQSEDGTWLPVWVAKSASGALFVFYGCWLLCVAVIVGGGFVIPADFFTYFFILVIFATALFTYVCVWGQLRPTLPRAHAVALQHVQKQLAAAKARRETALQEWSTFGDVAPDVLRAADAAAVASLVQQRNIEEQHAQGRARGYPSEPGFRRLAELGEHQLAVFTLSLALLGGTLVGLFAGVFVLAVVCGLLSPIPIPVALVGTFKTRWIVTIQIPPVLVPSQAALNMIGPAEV